VRKDKETRANEELTIKLKAQTSRRGEEQKAKSLKKKRKEKGLGRRGVATGDAKKTEERSKIRGPKW